MVAINQSKEDERGEEERCIEIIVSSGIPLYEYAKGEFGEDTFYYLDGEAYHISDLPKELVKTLGFIIETYFRHNGKSKLKTG